MWGFERIFTVFGQRRLPNRDQLVAYFKGPMLTDSVGESVITFTDGDASDFENSTFQFDYDATMAAVDTALGGGVLFAGTTPIVRTYAEWVALAEVNSGVLYIGPSGIAIYSTGQGDPGEVRILRTLGYSMQYVTVDGEVLFVDNYPIYIEV